MRCHCERNVVESIRKGWSSSRWVFVCTARFWNHQNDKKFGPVSVKSQPLKMYMGLRYIYPVRIDIILYQMYQLVGGFPAKFVPSRISQNIFFTWLVIRTSFSFFERGRFQNCSINPPPPPHHCNSDLPLSNLRRKTHLKWEIFSSFERFFRNSALSLHGILDPPPNTMYVIINHNDMDEWGKCNLYCRNNFCPWLCRPDNYYLHLFCAVVENR